MKLRQGSCHMGSCHTSSCHMVSCPMGTPWQQHSQEAWPQPAPGLWGHIRTPTLPSRPPPEGAWTQKGALGKPPG